MTKRVAIIGAGPSGLAQLRAFQSAADKGAEVPVSRSQLANVRRALNLA